MRYSSCRNIQTSSGKSIRRCNPSSHQASRQYPTGIGVKVAISLALTIVIIVLFYSLIYLPEFLIPIRSVFIVGMITIIYICIYYLHIIIGKQGKFICDNRVMDLWSLAHFLGFFGITLLLVQLFQLSFPLAAVIVIGGSTAWEFLEYGLRKSHPNFACESLGNHIMDILFNSAGVFIAFFFL